MRQTMQVVLWRTGRQRDTNTAHTDNDHTVMQKAKCHGRSLIMMLAPGRAPPEKIALEITLNHTPCRSKEMIPRPNASLSVRPALGNGQARGRFSGGWASSADLHSSECWCDLGWAEKEHKHPRGLLLLCAWLAFFTPNAKQLQMRYGAEFFLSLTH